MFNLITAIVAIATSSPSPVAAPTRLYSEPITAAIRGIVHQEPDSGMRVDDAGALVFEKQYNDECAFFTNLSSKPVRRVRIRFSFRDANDVELGWDVMAVLGPFAPGASAGSWQSPSRECKEFRGYVDGAGPQTNGWYDTFQWNVDIPHVRHFLNKSTTLTASVIEVDFGDGTLWQKTTIVPGTSN